MLTSDQQKDIITKFCSKVPHYKCPMCGTDRYKFMNGFILMPMHDNTTHHNQNFNSSLPCISVVCENCGYISFFSSMFLGLSS